MKYSPDELISRFLLDSMTQEQAEAFSDWIKESPDHGRLLIRSALLHRGIHEHFRNTDINPNRLQEDDLTVSHKAFEDEFWAQLSREERNAPAMHIPKESRSAPKASGLQKIETAPRTYPKGQLWFSIVSIAATFLLFLYVWTHPRHIPQDVATVADIYQAKWADTAATIQKETRLFDNRKNLNLLQGVIKLQFDSGAQVVIQGPAEFSIEAYERMKLNHGKLYAKVPPQAVGFRVNAPNCSLIDLGTEFGINVTSLGETDVHLVKGKASLVTSFQKLPQQNQILHQQQAQKVTSSGDVQSISFQESEFVRDFDSEKAVLWNGDKLNLASVVTGRNGFNGFAHNVGIDQKTGRLVSGSDEEREKPKVEGYVSVPDIPFVDGVFVPDGETGPVQLTSAGHVFNEFGNTNGQYYMPIGAYSLINMYTQADRKYTSIHLEEYPPESAVNLCLHANSGITFDLQKIREAMPFINITRFTSVYGIPKTREDQDNVTSDFYVFVDGAPLMIKRGVSNRDKPGHVSIPLAKTDRFLTLVCTEGQENFGDWSLFVNPALELELAN